MKKYVISCCLLCACIYTQAQTKWTLKKCIDFAIENNIEIKQQAVAVKSSEVDVSTSKNSRLPNLNGQAKQSFNFGQSILLANNSATRGDLTTTQFGISTNAPLFTGFKIPNQIKMNEFNLLAATEGLKKAKENIQIQVAGYYLEVLFKKEIVKVYKDQVALSNTQVERTDILVQAGKVPRSQLYDVKAQLAKDEQNVVMATNDLDLALLNLAQSLNMLDIKNFDIVEPIVGDVVGDNMASIVPPDHVYGIAVAERPVIKQAEYNVESMKKALKVAQADYYPTLSFDASYGTGFNQALQKNKPLDPISQQLGYNQSKTFGFTLNIPIFNRFQVRNKVRSARLDIENTQLALENTKLALFKEIQQSYQSATAAQAKYMATENATLAAEESLNYAQERYNIGKSTVFEFNDARTKLFSSKSDQLQAKYDFLFRAKILDFYSGKPIDIN